MKKMILVLISVIIFLFIATPTFSLLFLKSLGKAPSKKDRENYATRSSNFDGKKFYNIEKFELLENVPKNVFDENTISKKGLKPKSALPIKKSNFSKIPTDKVNATWFGHSSLLLQMSGKTILFDPVFSKMISPVSFAGVKRFSDSGVKIEDLPEIDILIISHDHYDHLDYKSIKALDSKVKKYIVSLGVESHLKYWKIDSSKIQNMAWWEEIEIDELKIACTPSQHFSGRKLIDSSRTLWSSWVLKDANHQIFECGDSGYSSHFKEIHEKYGNFDFAFMECGQYNLKWKKIHSFPEEAVQAALDLQAKAVMPIHWGALVLSEHAWDDSVSRFVKASGEQNLPTATPYLGETFDLDDLTNSQERWWNEID